VIQFTVYGDPSPKGSARAFIPKGWTRPIITSATKGLKAWESKIASAAGAQADGRLLTGAVIVTVAFYLSRPKSAPKKLIPHITRPDLDKLIRGATDALTGIVWKDDAQAIEIRATKAYVDTGEDAPRAEFTILPLAEQEFILRPGVVGDF
jgi:Holliday junction resolvase RusA-like endonuclease